MASSSVAAVRTTDNHLQTGLQNGIGLGESQDSQPLLQVQGPSGSPQPSDRASSEHSKIPLDLNADQISRHSSSQENIRTSAWQSKYILALDGGGVRGYSSLLIIQELMRICASLEMRDNPAAVSSFHPISFQLPQGSSMIQNDRKRSARYLPTHYFDYIAGTSTGGLIAIMLSRLRMSIDECIEEYKTMGKHIFGNQLPLFNIQRRILSLRGPIPWNREKYDHKKLANVVQDVVDRRLHVSRDRAAGQMFPSDESLCRTIVTAVKDNNASGAPYIFRTYNHRSQERDYVFNPGPADNVRITDVARATTAAPTYFKPIVINGQKFLDGGFCTNANNPSQVAYNEVLLMHGNNPDAVALLVSIGTGRLKNGNPFPKTNDMFSKYKATINYAVHAASDSEDTHRTMRQNMAAHKRPYERFNVDGGLEHVKLGDWKLVSQRHASAPVNVTLQTIEDATRAYCQQREVRRRLERTAEMLVRNRQLRSTTPQWDLAATGWRYRCAVTHCMDSQILHDSEELLRDHLVARHGFTYPPGTERERTGLEAMIRQGKIQHAE